MVDAVVLASRALEYHIGLLDEIRRREVNPRFLPSAGVYQSIMDVDTGEVFSDTQDMYVEAMAKAIEAGDTYAVATPMLQLATYASDSLPEAWTFVPELLLTGAGVALFETAVTLGEESFHALLWINPPDSPCVIFLFGTEGSAIVFSGWLFEVGEGLLGQGSEASWPDLHAERFVASLLELMHQRISARERGQPSRAARRAAAPWKPEPLVTIIRLRRTKPRDGEGEDDEDAPDWSCRWLVRGHWREQWLRGSRTHATIWISPYVKGPEDKPLKLTGATVRTLVQ